MNRRQVAAAFQSWWLSVNKALPPTRASLLPKFRKLGELEARLIEMRAELGRATRELERYEDQQAAFLAAHGEEP